MANGDRETPIETLALGDSLATDLEIQDMGFGLKLLVWTAPHPVGQGKIERRIVSHLVVPEVCLIPINQKISKAADEIMETVLTLVPNGNGNRNQTA